MGLSFIAPDAIDSATIKKARRRLLADLDLADGYHCYYNQQLDRSACEQACADLDHPEKLRAWHRLANQPALSAFLATGQIHFLTEPPTNVRSLKNDADLIAIVGLRYAAQFDQALLSAFQEDDIGLLETLRTAPILYPVGLSAVAYRSVSRRIRQQIDFVDRLTERLDENDDEQTATEALDDLLSGCYHSSNLNALADEHFRGLRSEFALSVRHYSIKLFNTFYTPDSASLLLQQVAEIDIDEQARDRIEKDLEQIGEIEEKNRVQEEQQAQANRFGRAFEQLLAYQKQLEAGTVAAATVQKWSAGLAPLIRELNVSQEEGIVAIRDSFALGLRGISVEIWNKKSDGKVALAVLDVGLAVGSTTKTRSTLQADKQQLTKLNNELAQVRQVPSSRPLPSPASSSSGLPSWVWFVGILIVLGFMMNMCGDSNTTTSTYPPSTTTPNTSSANSSGANELPDQLPHYSEYKGNQLQNGASPLDDCFGKGKYAGPAWIVFRNINSDTDAIVCLARTRDNKIIRNEYIKAGTDFKMSRIPAGSYYLKVFYGRDWNPKRRNACGTKGVFDTDDHFSVSRDPSDLIAVEVSSRSYTTGEITLYTVAGGNMAQQAVSEDEFFKQ